MMIQRAADLDRARRIQRRAARREEVDARLVADTAPELLEHIDEARIRLTEDLECEGSVTVWNPALRKVIADLGELHDLEVALGPVDAISTGKISRHERKGSAPGLRLKGKAVVALLELAALGHVAVALRVDALADLGQLDARWGVFVV